ncbi:MAG TPA: hypothetical protein VFB74_36290 [Kribbellaceae bacterium]|nr:hypothetical protein [Kribbellaceae bacterium]
MRSLAPALRTVAALVVLIVSVGLLSWQASDGTSEGDRVTELPAWAIWCVLAATSVLAFAGLLARGVELIGEHRTLPAASGRRLLGFFVLATLIAIAVWVTLLAAGGWQLAEQLPINHLRVRTTAVLSIGMLAALPWLVLVWLVHAECREIGAAARRAVAADPPEDQHPLYDAAQRLLALWDLLVRCVLAFLVFVVAAVTTSGALRALFVDALPERSDEFPPSAVLLYGMVFALVLLVISIPMIASWRAKASYIAQRLGPVPTDLVVTEGWLEQQARTAALLHLDVPLLRSPLTLLAALTPIVTSLVATFLPLLGE